MTEVKMAEKYYSVAIDGPSGAGKSTLARKCAAEFGFVYVDTGAIYRTVGLAAINAGVDSKDADGVAALLGGLSIEMRYGEDGVQHMLLNGEDVTSRIREAQVSKYASDVSAMPPVRAFLLEMQRDMARRHSVIMDGRDIGTVVLPDADVKIFLSASAEERAKRRYDELKGMGREPCFAEVLDSINYRDINDSTRAAAPLKPAEDALMLDTTGNTLEESTELMISVIKDRLGI